MAGSNARSGSRRTRAPGAAGRPARPADQPSKPAPARSRPARQLAAKPARPASGPPVPRQPSFYLRVYACVRLVPKGRVTTYGAVATWLGSPRAARAVGYALAARLPRGVPWQRVVNRLGEISVGGPVWRPEEQRRRLQQEGVRFGKDGAIALKTYAFVPTHKQLVRAEAAARSGP